MESRKAPVAILQNLLGAQARNCFFLFCVKKKTRVIFFFFEIFCFLLVKKKKSACEKLENAFKSARENLILPLKIFT